MQGRGVADLVERIVELLPATDTDEETAGEPAGHALGQQVGDGDGDCNLPAEVMTVTEQMAGWLVPHAGGAKTDDGAKSDDWAATGRDQYKLAVVGRPNVGKSSLLNRLLGAPRSVVHAEPGTTRDSVALSATWRDHEILIADTAGIRPKGSGGRSREELDRLAVERAEGTIVNSHVALLVLDASQGYVSADGKV